MSLQVAYFRFYAELNDFLPPTQQQITSVYHFNGMPAIKEAIEAVGVPHTEVDLIMVNGVSVAFEYRLRDGDRVAVYPVFESFDISPLLRLRPQPLRETQFILDVHLGKLAKYLRLLGFDTLYRNDYQDPDIIAIALRERRVSGVSRRLRDVLRPGTQAQTKWLSRGWHIAQLQPWSGTRLRLIFPAVLVCQPHARHGAQYDLGA